MKKQDPLPAKDKGNFNSIVKLYEQKHYRKAVKLADNILKRHPNHGETLAMKGLAMNEMGKPEEAMELVKLGIRNDMRSHVTWHVLGLVHRARREYKDAVKCYRQALRIDPDNLNILRDASLLQIQMRDHRGFVESRRRLLTLKPTLKVNWIGFAVAHHLNKNYDMVLQVLRMYEGTLAADKAKASQRNYDTNEVALYGCNVLEEAGRLEDALAYLDSKKDKVLDDATYSERRAQLLLRLGRGAEARELFEALVERNPENYAYHRGLHCCLLNTPEHLNLKACTTPGMVMELTEEQVNQLTEVYDTMRAANARCRAHRRIPLDFLPASSPAFRAHLDTILRRDLRKGLPSLFMHLKSLYAQPGKGAVIGELCEGYLAALAAGARLPVAPGATPDATPDQPEDPTLVVWVKMFSGQHFDKVGQHPRALALFDEAILHTPTVLDLYMWRGRVLKHAGQLKAAAESYDQGRRLDLADRYISAKTAKYQLRAGMEEQGEVTANLFSRDTRSVTDMQCMWFEIEAGNCHMQNKHYGKALQKFLLVESHFKDYKYNQFDFHTYCLRKMTLRAYLGCMDVIDHMPEHERYQQAMRGIVRAYLALADVKAERDAAKAAAEAKKAAEAKPLTAKQRKAAKNAARRKKKKKEALAEAATTAAAAAGAGEAESKQTHEEKLAEEVAKLEGTEAPLEEAAKYARKLQDSGKQDVESQLCVFDVALRRGRLLQALRALRMAAAAPGGDAHPGVFRAKVQFIVAATGEAAAGATEAVRTVLASELAQPDLLPGGLAVATLVANHADAHRASLPHRIVAAEMMVFVDGSKLEQGLALLADTTGEGVTLANCIAANTAMQGLGSGDAVTAKVAAHKEACHALFPLATEFGAAALGEAEYGSLLEDETPATDGAGAGSA